MNSVILFVVRLAVAIMMGLFVVRVEAAPSGQYCASIPIIFSISLTFRDDTFDVSARYFANRASVQGVSYSLTSSGIISVSVNDPRFRDALSSLGAPASASDFESLTYANDQITASTNLGSLTLTKGQC
ncbi:hypothetical protein FOZ60_002376 [Perkinsus olseni]|uniref:Uncharacterized protein n=1 Tax=Perkinsus olseni TaxID=32597 RepID=A0A7J6NYB1_PEROL|nr:hypothetical protein FOZ60_002376 [Perkinsus olseni]